MVSDCKSVYLELEVGSSLIGGGILLFLGNIEILLLGYQSGFWGFILKFYLYLFI